MKFKVKLEKENLILMTFVIIILFITCAFWLTLEKYNYFIFYIVLTLIIVHMYYFTSYYVDKKYLIIKLGFLKIKFKLKNIKKVKGIDNKVRVELNKLSMFLYPEDKKEFINYVKNKIKG